MQEVSLKSQMCRSYVTDSIRYETICGWPVCRGSRWVFNFTYFYVYISVGLIKIRWLARRVQNMNFRGWVCLFVFFISFENSRTSLRPAFLKARIGHLPIKFRSLLCERNYTRELLLYFSYPNLASSTSYHRDFKRLPAYWNSTWKLPLFLIDCNSCTLND